MYNEKFKIMKNLLFLIIAVAFFLDSCSSQQNEKKANQNVNDTTCLIFTKAIFIELAKKNSWTY